MDDPVLMSRLEALRNNLNVVAENLDSKAWQPEQSRLDSRAELLGESSLWTGLETTLIKEIRKHLAELTKVEKDLVKAPPLDHAAVSAAWVRYAKTLGDSQGLLRECLEIIGTLAIRTKDLDHKILYVADELIRDCMTLSTGDPHYYLLVHSLGATFSKTRARIIRLRFPEWTIWDLPLVAHELGQVAITEILVREQAEDETLRTLTRFLANQQDSLVASDPDLNKKHQAAGEQATEAERWAQNRVRVFLADAFATYTLGPAYACSAIMLRLSPSAVAQPDVPSDSQRGHVIMSMLRWMNDKAPIPKPYSDVIAHLDKAWQNTFDRSNPGSKPGPNQQAHLEQLAEVFYLTLNGTAMYPHQAPRDGWRKAQEWSGAWLDQWRKNLPLKVPVDAVGKLRDVLNATWLCRLEIDESPAVKNRAHLELALAAKNLSNVIIQARTGGSLIRSAPTPVGG